MKYSIIIIFLLGGCARSSVDEALKINEGNLNEKFNDKISDQFIRNSIGNDWNYLEKRNWEIEYRDEKGMPSNFNWYISGTMWKVQVFGTLTNEDKEITKKYEFYGIALSQGYGLVDIYNYDHSFHEIKR